MRCVLSCAFCIADRNRGWLMYSVTQRYSNPDIWNTNIVRNAPNIPQSDIQDIQINYPQNIEERKLWTLLFWFRREKLSKCKKYRQTWLLHICLKKFLRLQLVKLLKRWCKIWLSRSERNANCEMVLQFDIYPYVWPYRQSGAVG